MLDSFDSKPQTHPKSMLSEDDVCMIFMAGKPCATSATMKLRNRGQILALAKKFQVTPKTIRDIWNRRTWRNVTSRLIADSAVIFDQQLQLETNQRISGHVGSRPCSASLQGFSGRVETGFMPDQQAAGATSEIDLEHSSTLGVCQTRRRPDRCLESLKPTSCETERFEPRPYLHWPGDALLLAAGARSHLDEAGYEELPTQGGVDSAADPFAGDWAY